MNNEPVHLNIFNPQGVKILSKELESGIINKIKFPSSKGFFIVALKYSDGLYFSKLLKQ